MKIDRQTRIINRHASRHKTHKYIIKNVASLAFQNCFVDAFLLTYTVIHVTLGQ